MLLFKATRVRSKILVTLTESLHKKKIDLIDEIINDVMSRNPQAWKVASTADIASSITEILIKKRVIDISEVKKKFRMGMILGVCDTASSEEIIPSVKDKSLLNDKEDMVTKNKKIKTILCIPDFLKTKLNQNQQMIVIDILTNLKKEKTIFFEDSTPEILAKFIVTMLLTEEKIELSELTESFQNEVTENVVSILMES